MHRPGPAVMSDPVAVLLLLVAVWLGLVAAMWAMGVL